jgi:hypothetical protein
MTIRATLRRWAREWLIGLCGYALLVAPFGCEFENLLTTTVPDDVAKSPPATGLFINTDLTAPLMAAGQGPSGNSVFNYGKRTSMGDIAEVDSILVRSAAGEESFVVFELGRPTYLQGADGSYVRITYHDVSPPTLAATVEVHDPGSETSETVDVQIDLAAAAAEMAQVIQDLTGLPLAVPIAPLPVSSAKVHDRAIGPLVAGLIGASLVLVSQLMVVVMAQVMQAAYQTVSAAMQAALLAAFMPVFLFAGLMGEITVQLGSYPLLEIFVELPGPPRPGA